ncbi:sensor histidine kinase [Ilumatobacter sp.]|uniref:sensor histidine kinase n=2 Tax=Ilumatobacter sp. TaxID=1967498 RepID=UPI003750C2EE
MLDRLEASNIAQAQFVSDASHELRTPIAVIRHELEVLIRTDDDTRWREVAGDVLDENLRMQRLVEDLLLLARREGRAGDPPRVDRSLVDLDDIVLGEAHRVHTDKVIGTSGISAGQVRGNSDQLIRVVRNLVDNALRHAQARVLVSVTSTDEGLVVLAVEDDGPGVAEPDRERIFERFRRSDEARTRDDGGSGLGLAIVAGIVADHFGTVSVDMSPALGGARFAATLADARL